MAKKRTWLWILVAVLGVMVMCVIAVASFGVYFMSQHVKASSSTSAEAFRAFDEARERFKDTPPLFELDQREKPKLTRRLEELPTAATHPQMMYVLAWDPDKERLARVTLPFWMLRFGRKRIDLTNGLDFQRLQIDVEQLERVGPVLLFDYRPPSGRRVLVWTQ